MFDRGKNVLNQKSELQRALEKHKDNLAKKELEHQLTQSTPELEKVIADRAKRLQDTPVQVNKQLLYIFVMKLNNTIIVFVTERR